MENLQEVAEALAARLEGWTTEPAHKFATGTTDSVWRFTGPGEFEEFTIRSGGYGTDWPKVEASMLWPRFTTGTGHKLMEGLAAYGENLPGITFTGTKKIERIVGDITRRLLPDLRGIAAKARQRDADETDRLRVREEGLQAAGLERAQHNEKCVYLADRDTPEALYEVEQYHGGGFRVTTHEISGEQVARLVEMFRQWDEENGV